MKRVLLMLTMLGLFSAGIIGCHADAGVDIASSVPAAR
jgi:hypothetical protein